MKLNKIITKALLAFTAMVGFASCSSDNYEMTGKPNNGQVYFSNEASTEYLLSENQNKVEVEVKRVNTSGALTVDVQATDESGLFTVASNVTFADGEATAKLPINFDFSNLEADKDYPVTLTLKAETCEYGDNSTTVNIKYAPWSEWEKMGDGTNPVFTYTNFESGSYEQPTYYRESMLDPTKAQLMLEDWLYGVNLVVDWNKADNTLKISPQFSGYVHPSYGQVMVADTYTYLTEVRGKEGVDYDTYKSYYDEATGCFYLHDVYYVSAGTFGNGYETLQLPGYEQSDYSISIEDCGSYQSGKKLGQVFNMTMGADLSSMKYAVFQGSLSEEEIKEKAEGIFAGDIESTATTESGYKLTLVDAEGDYTLVAIGYDADSKFVTTESLEFTVKAPTAGNTWTEKFIGNYTYTLIFANEDDSPAVDEGLTLSACNEDNTLFKISPWANDAELLFTYDAEGKVTVLDGETGVSSSKYGAILVGEAANYSSKYAKYSSSFDATTNTFKFCVAYYCTEGSFGVGYETFTITSEAAAKMKAARAKAMEKAKKLRSNAKVVKFTKDNLHKFTPNSRTTRVLSTKTIK